MKKHVWGNKLNNVQECLFCDCKRFQSFNIRYMHNEILYFKNNQELKKAPACDLSKTNKNQLTINL